MQRKIKTYTLGQRVMLHTNRASTLQRVVSVGRIIIELDNGDLFNLYGDRFGERAPDCDWIESLTEDEIADICGVK